MAGGPHELMATTQGSKDHVRTMVEDECECYIIVRAYDGIEESVDSNEVHEYIPPLPPHCCYC